MKNKFLVILILLVAAIIFFAIAIVFITKKEPIKQSEISAIETDINNFNLKPEDDFNDLSPDDFQYSNKEEVSDINSSLNEIDVLLKSLEPATDFDDLGDLEF